jgi:hypothetical protein
MKSLLWMAITVVTMHSAEARAIGGRSLPAGADQIATVEKVYQSPRGEVHFVEISGGHSVMLRNNKGDLASFKEVRGPSQCDAWLISNKSETIPGGCDFIFHDELMGGLYSVRSDEMEESSLFQVVRSTLERKATGGGDIVSL